MSVRIDIKKLEAQRIENSFDKDVLRKAVKEVLFDSKIEDYLYKIFLKMAEIDDTKYIYLPTLAKVIDVPLYKLKLAIPKVKKMILESERLILANMRGVGYKIGIEKEATEEFGKSMSRGLSHMHNFYRAMEMSEYDWQLMKNEFPQHYEFFMVIQVTSKNMRLFYEAHRQAFEEFEKYRKLINKLRADTSQPEFFLDRQQELALN